MELSMKHESLHASLLDLEALGRCLAHLARMAGPLCSGALPWPTGGPAQPASSVATLSTASRPGHLHAGPTPAPAHL